MAKKLSKAAAEALAATDWKAVDAMTDAMIARQIAANPEAAAYQFSLRTVQKWERGAKRPSGPARTLLRAIRNDPEGLRRAIAAA